MFHNKYLEILKIYLLNLKINFISRSWLYSLGYNKIYVGKKNFHCASKYLRRIVLQTKFNFLYEKEV